MNFAKVNDKLFLTGLSFTNFLTKEDDNVYFNELKYCWCIIL